MNDFDNRYSEEPEISMIADFDGDESSIFSNHVNEELPILCLRDIVLFPGVILPVQIGRAVSLKLIKYCHEHKIQFGALTQRYTNVEEPGPNDLFNTGIVVRILRVLDMPDGKKTAILQGQSRFAVDSFLPRTSNKHWLTAKVHELKDEGYKLNTKEFTTLVSSCREMASQLMLDFAEGKNDFVFAMRNITNHMFFVNFCCANLPFTINEKIELLEKDYLIDRSYGLLKTINTTMQYVHLRKYIHQKTQEELSEQQKEYFLQQEIKNLQEELGNSSDAEIEEMRNEGLNKKWSKETYALFKKELDKLERIVPQSPDYNVQYNYLKTVLALPWNEYSDDNLDIVNAQKVLDRDHYGMEKVKERILEHLAVARMRSDLRSPILCLYGPPGVGKTSLGRSIADALNRKYVRVSLGGLHDEAEIRGHRRTYIGAMAGRILKNIQKAGTSNPVFILDEIDKITQQTMNGDPASALLEVLDPEQNSTFHDNYLDMDFDLSRVMFIATANDISTIPSALRDRMEMIEVPGYITEEKVEIARRHLIPKAKKEIGLKTNYDDIKIGKSTIEKIIEDYTRESGVRQLEKMISKLLRKEALHYALKGEFSQTTVRPKDVKDLLGTELFNRDKYQGNDYAGVVTGLAWTSVGGEILFVEVGLSKSKTPRLSLTGSLGDVMKESAILALEYVKAHASKYGIDSHIFDEYSIHIHVPDGATPKDGPSAGITLTTAIISALTQRKVRKNLAMTGEITLRGKVTPVGGIREKILAAKRAGIKELILCKENKRNIDEIPALYLEGLEFHYVDDIQEVISTALLDEKVKNPVEFTFTENKEAKK